MFGPTDRPQQKLSVKDTSEVVCDTCKGNVFNQGMFLRKVSALLTGQPKDSYLPIDAFIVSSVIRLMIVLFQRN